MAVVVYKEPPTGTPEKTDTFAEPFFTTTRPFTAPTNEIQAEQAPDEAPRFSPHPFFNFVHFGFVPRAQRRTNPESDQPRFERTYQEQSAPRFERANTQRTAPEKTVDPEVLSALKNAITNNAFIKALPQDRRSSNVNPNDLYSLLGLTQNVTAQEIRKAFRSLSLTLHPDKGGHVEAYKLANEAYNKLSAEHIDREPSVNQRQAAPQQPERAPAAAEPAPNAAEQPADPFDQILEEALAGLNGEAPAQEDLPPANETDRILEEALASLVEELGPPPAFQERGPVPAFVEELSPPAYEEGVNNEPPAYQASVEEFVLPPAFQERGPVPAFVEEPSPPAYEEGVNSEPPAYQASVEEFVLPPAFQERGPVPAFVEEPSPPAYEEVANNEPPAYKASAEAKVNENVGEVLRELPTPVVVLLPPSA